jgi:hypothetical protein
MLVILQGIFCASHNANACHKENNAEYQAGGDQFYIVSAASMINKIPGAHYKPDNAEKCKNNTYCSLFHDVVYYAYINSVPSGCFVTNYLCETGIAAIFVVSI